MWLTVEIFLLLPATFLAGVIVGRWMVLRTVGERIKRQ